jgi:CDP-glycerol glycerophosphotransferase (TagB/SpsB family)
MKVAIIIPLQDNYPAEDIHKTISIFKKQSLGFENFQIIFVNHSNENKELFDIEFEQNIKVVNELDIREIESDYISFCKIHYAIGIDMFKHLLKLLKEKNVDFVSAHLNGAMYEQDGDLIDMDFKSITSFKLIKKHVLLHKDFDYLKNIDDGTINLLSYHLYLKEFTYYYSEKAKYQYHYTFDEGFLIQSIHNLQFISENLLKTIDHSKNPYILHSLIKEALFLIDKYIFLNNLEERDQNLLFNLLNTLSQYVDLDGVRNIEGYKPFLEMIQHDLHAEAVEYMKLLRSKRHWYNQTKKYEHFFQRNPHNIEESLSWKITKPLRKIASAYKMSKDFLYKVLILFFSLMVRISHLNKPIWLVGEREDQAEDNGYFFFKYCRENHPKQKVFYIINKESPHLYKVEKLGNVIYHSSFKHKVYMLAAKLYISAWTFEEVSYPHPKEDFIKLFHDKLSAKKNICLQHGVIIHNISPYLHKDRYKQDLIIASSEYEKKIIKKTLGYSDQEVAVTGLARFDNLYDRKTKNQILIMPTWRRHLFKINKHDFLKSEYYKTYKELITDQQFLKIIEDNNIEVKFYIHSQMQRFMDHFVFEHPNIEFLVKSNATVSELLKESALLITDYSSVSSDFLYMEKPILLYQFDPYNNHHAPVEEIKYSDLGTIVSNKQELLEQMSRIVQNGFTIDRKYLKNSNRIFKYKDQENCKRIYETVVQL